MPKKDVKQAAAEVRKVLKSTYSGVKFSVCSDRYAGGSAVRVSWTDGPTGKEVSAATAHLKGYENGYYNDYITTARSVSHAVMEAAARAAADYYRVEMPKISGGDHPYVDDYTVVTGLTIEDKYPEAIQDKIHRAAHATSLYNTTPEEAFAAAYPN